MGAVKTYRVAWSYQSGRGSFSAGQLVELPAYLAAEINLDSPGVLVEVGAEPERALAEAPNRMQAAAPNRAAAAKPRKAKG